MNLTGAKEGVEYKILRIETGDDEMNSFLFSLGCYEGEKITVVTHFHSSLIVAIKDARYNLDKQLARTIIVAE